MHISYITLKSSSAKALLYISEASAQPVETRMARIFPYLDVHISLGTDGPSAGLYDKFIWLEVTLSCPSPGWRSGVQHMSRAGDTGVP